MDRSREVPALRYCVPLSKGIVGARQRRADVQMKRYDVGADHADVVERRNVDRLYLGEVLVDLDADIGDAAEAAHRRHTRHAGAGAAGHRRHCVAVELAGAG